jgi:hypothetical protein
MSQLDVTNSVRQKVDQLGNEVTVFYGTQRFIFMFIKLCHYSEIVQSS